MNHKFAVLAYNLLLSNLKELNTRKYASFLILVCVVQIKVEIHEVYVSITQKKYEKIHDY